MRRNLPQKEKRSSRPAEDSGDLLDHLNILPTHPPLSNPLLVFDLLGSPANKKHATQVTQASQATHTAQPPCFPLILFSKDNTPVARKKLVEQCSVPSCLIPQQFHYPRPVNRGRPGEANFLLLKTLIGRYRRPTTLLAHPSCQGFCLVTL